MIELITNDKKVKDIVTAIHLQDSFLFIYSVCKLTKVKGNNPNPGHNVDDFKAGTMVAVKFQLVLRNFKVFKKIDVVKIYLFCLLGVYLINNPALLIMSTLEKRCQGDDE